MVPETALLQDLGFIVLAGTFFAFLFKKLNQPLVVAYIFAGVLLGPIGLRIIHDTQNIAVLAQLGVAFLLFALGMEIDFSKVWKFKHSILWGGLAQIAINMAVVAALVRLAGVGLIEAVYVGFIVAFSSTVVIVKILSDRKQLNSLEGKLIIGYALVQDIVAVIILPLLANPAALLSLPLLGGILASLAVLILLGVLVSKWVFPKLVQWSAKSPEIFYLSVLSSFFFFTAVSLYLKFPLAAGAFIGGLALSRTAFGLEALGIIRNIRDLFATVFFVSLGMQLTILPFDANLLVFAVMLGAVFILNPLVFTLVNLSEGFGLQISVFIGLALAQASEFSFILASHGHELGQLSESLYNLSIWTIIISMVATPYMLGHAESIHRFIRKHFLPKPVPFFRRKLEKLEKLPAENELENHSIIVGAGVFGSTLANELQDKTRVMIVDQDPEVVARFIGKGFFALFDSQQNQEVWEKTGLAKAKLLIVTIPHQKSALGWIAAAKKQNKNSVVFVRAHYYKDTLELYKAGADLVIMPQIIGSNFALQAVTEFLETGQKPRHAPLEEEYFNVLKEKAKEENTA